MIYGTSQSFLGFPSRFWSLELSSFFILGGLHVLITPKNGFIMSLKCPSLPVHSLFFRSLYKVGLIVEFVAIQIIIDSNTFVIDRGVETDPT